MGKILLTRSEPGASQWAQYLSSHGFDVVCTPLVEVVGMDPIKVTRLEPHAVELQGVPTTAPRIAIFLSAHASACFVDAGLLERLQQTTCIAIGDATAAVLRTHGISVAVPELTTSEGVLAMPELAQLQRGDSVWLLAGFGGRILLAQSLSEQYHCEVVKFELYRRRGLDLPPLDVEAVAVVVVSSEAALEVLSEQWFEQQGSATVVLIVPSERVALSARKSGFQQVHVSDNASATATLDILQQLKASKSLQ